jgi:hypothetical protein
MSGNHLRYRTLELVVRVAIGFTVINENGHGQLEQLSAVPSDGSVTLVANSGQVCLRKSHRLKARN